MEKTQKVAVQGWVYVLVGTLYGRFDGLVGDNKLQFIEVQLMGYLYRMILYNLQTRYRFLWNEECRKISLVDRLARIYFQHLSHLN